MYVLGILDVLVQIVIRLILWFIINTRAATSIKQEIVSNLLEHAIKVRRIKREVDCSFEDFARHAADRIGISVSA